MAVAVADQQFSRDAARVLSSLADDLGVYAYMQTVLQKALSYDELPDRAKQIWQAASGTKAVEHIEAYERGGHIVSGYDRSVFNKLTEPLKGMTVKFEEQGGSPAMPQTFRYMNVDDAKGQRVGMINYGYSKGGLDIHGIAVKDTMQGKGIAVAMGARLHETLGLPLIHGGFSSLAGVRFGVFMAAAFPEWNKLVIDYSKDGDVYWTPGDPLPVPTHGPNNVTSDTPPHYVPDMYGPLKFGNYDLVPGVIQQALADAERVRAGKAPLVDGDVKSVIHVHPYIREGHPVGGYERDLEESLGQVRPEIIKQATEKRSKLGQGDRYTRTTTPVKGKSGTRQALLIQAREYFLKGDDFWRDTLKRRLSTATTKTEKDQVLLDLYNQRTKHHLFLLTRRASGARVAVRVPHEAVTSILSSGKILNAHDPAHRPNDRTSKEDGKYLTGRAEAERAVFGIPEAAGPEAYPTYGYVAVDREHLDKSIARAFGDVKVTLKDDVRPRTTVTYSDSLFIGIGHADAVPSPINDPSELSVVHWMNLGGVETPVMYKGEQANPEPPLPPKLRKLQDEITAIRANNYDVTHKEEALRMQKNEWLDKIGYSFWPHGDFIETQIHGGVSLADIERIDFPQDAPPDAATQEALKSADIHWTVGGP